MKRSRDEVEQPGAQPKQPPPEAHVGADGQTLTPKDALSYLKSVKDAFKDNKPIYKQFLDLMKDYKSQRTNTVGVVERVIELFQGHQDLILGFNTFLPAGYAIKLPLEDPVKKAAELKEAVSFVNKIKVRFRAKDHIYNSFVDILNQFRNGNKPIGNVHREVCALFQNHPDLLEEFARFLPDSTVAADNYYAASAKKSASPALSVDKLERTNGLPFDHGRDPDPGRILKFEERKLSEKYRDGRENGHGSKDFGHGENMQQLPNNHSNGNKIEKEGSDKLHLMMKKQKLNGVLHQDIIFCEEVKKRMQKPAEFAQFLKCLHIYRKDLITRKELVNLVADFIGRESDLLARFPDFLTHCKNIDECLAFYSSNQQHSEENGANSVKAKDRDWDRELRERDRNTGFGNKDNMAQKPHSYASKDKYIAKPISELDLSNCERCTPSYRLLPVDYPIPSATQRSSLGAQVLNDHWVSVTSGSEDYSFKHMRKNQYEESLFRCEDDRFELDMLLESVHVTVKRVEELQAKIDSRALMPGQLLRIEDHLNALNLRTIERLYGDHANDVMEVLKKNAALALPVVYTRLKQKQEEWLRCRAEFNKVWAEIYAKNYHKSLDHRSFYFKQQDTKSLSTKALLLEIKEHSENSRKEDIMLDGFDAWNWRPLKPNLTFEYPDPDIHEDLYQLVKYSCAEVCTTEQLEKAMNIWTSFIEPLLGGHPRPDDHEDSEDVANSISHDSRGGASPTSDSDCSQEGDNVKDSEQTSPLKTGNTPELSSSCRSRLVDRVKEDDSRLDHSPSKNDSTSASLRLARVHHDVVRVNNISGAMKQASLNEWPTDASLTNEAEGNKETNTGVASDGLAIMKRQSSSAVDNESMLEPSNVVSLVTPSKAVVEYERSTTPTNDSNVDRHREECARRGKPDREEGELSPNGDFEEDNFAVYADAPVDDASKTDGNMKNGSQINPGENTHPEATEVGLDHQNEETPQRSSEDSENPSDIGDASGSDSVEECFRENEGADNGKNDSKAESEDGAEEMDDEVHEVYGEGSLVPISERALSNVKPLAKHVPLAVQERQHSSRVFYGNDSLYVLLRLHQTLYERIRSAKVNSSSAEKKWKSYSSTSSTDQYARFMSALYSLLDGSSDNTKFEDDCRAIIGTQSYVLFTLDKLIFKLVKQLQTVAGDETDNKLLQLFVYENTRKPERFADSIYYENARVLLHDGNIYRMECWSTPCQLSIQLMDHGFEKPEITAVSIEPKFSLYLHDDFLGVNPNRRAKSGIFMKRNKCKNPYGDESLLEGLKMFNGLECKINCKTSKVSYVLDSTDVLYRPSKVRQTFHAHKKAKLQASKSARSHRVLKVFGPSQ